MASESLQRYKQQALEFAREQGKQFFLAYGLPFVQEHPIWAGWVPEMMARSQHIHYHNQEVYTQATKHLEQGFGLYVDVAPHRRTVDPALPILALDAHIPFDYRRGYVASFKWDDPEIIKELGLGLEMECLPLLERTTAQGFAELHDFDRFFVVQAPTLWKFRKQLTGANREAIHEYNANGIAQMKKFLAGKNILIGLDEGTRNLENNKLQPFQAGSEDFIAVPNVKVMHMWLAGVEAVSAPGNSGLKGFKTGQRIDIGVSPLFTDADLQQFASQVEWAEKPGFPLPLNHALGVHMADFAAGHPVIGPLEQGNWRGYYAENKLIRKGPQLQVVNVFTAAS